MSHFPRYFGGSGYVEGHSNGGWGLEMAKGSWCRGPKNQELPSTPTSSILTVPPHLSSFWLLALTHTIFKHTIACHGQCRPCHLAGHFVRFLPLTPTPSPTKRVAACGITGASHVHDARGTMGRSLHTAAYSWQSLHLIA